MSEESEKDGHAECVIDYVISWSLRCAIKEVSVTKPILYRNCKGLLCKLLNISNTNNVTFLSVKTWKQWENTDLVAEITVNNNGTLENHALLIEDKYYFKLKEHQLSTYKKLFEEHYLMSDKTFNWIPHYALITCIERDDPNFIKARHNTATDEGFEIFTYSELNCEFEECESDIFNELWLYW